MSRCAAQGSAGGCGAAWRPGQRSPVLRACPPHARPMPTPCPLRRDPKVALASNVVIAIVVSALAFGGLFPDQVASLWGLPPK